MEQSTHIENFSSWSEIEYYKIINFNDIPKDKFDFLIGGSGLISNDFVYENKGKIINVHPGIIPLVKGLILLNGLYTIFFL